MHTTPQLLDVVALLSDVPTHGLLRGQVGTVVELLGGAYEVLSSTNITAPLTNWTAVGSGNFDWLGNATVTNGISSGEDARFFTIRTF